VLPISAMPSGWACCSITRPAIARTGACGPGCATPGCATRRQWRTSTTALFQALAAGRWIEEAQNLIIEGPTGVGKSWLACALGHRACRDNRSVLYQRIPRLFADLALGRGDGRYARLMRALGGVKLLILDDWGLEPLGAEQRRDLLEIVEDRYGRGATLITSQVPVDRWHDVIGDPTLADAILDRLVHNAHRIQLRGESLRKTQAPKRATA
jgi:DNA replication protein DnaC